MTHKTADRSMVYSLFCRDWRYALMSFCSRRKRRKVGELGQILGTFSLNCITLNECPWTWWKSDNHRSSVTVRK